MPTVTGIGGFFFRAKDPEALAAWYKTHFGILPVPSDYESPVWQQQAGPTVFAPFPEDTDYFGPAENQWMLNLRVTDLDAAITALEEGGIQVTRWSEELPNGRFAHLFDSEGNRIELWEPKA